MDGGIREPLEFIQRLMGDAHPGVRAQFIESLLGALQGNPDAPHLASALEGPASQLLMMLQSDEALREALRDLFVDMPDPSEE